MHGQTQKQKLKKVLKNDLATKEELEAAIKKLGRKKYMSHLGSEKVKLKKTYKSRKQIRLDP